MIIEANSKFYVTTWHAEGEMFDENITSEESRSHINRWVYQYNNMVVIVNEASEQIITVFRVEK